MLLYFFFIRCLLLLAAFHNTVKRATPFTALPARSNYLNKSIFTLTIPNFSSPPRNLETPELLISPPFRLSSLPAVRQNLLEEPALPASSFPIDARAMSRLLNPPRAQRILQSDTVAFRRPMAGLPCRRRLTLVAIHQCHMDWHSLPGTFLHFAYAASPFLVIEGLSVPIKREGTYFTWLVRSYSTDTIIICHLPAGNKTRA